MVNGTKKTSSPKSETASERILLAEYESLHSDYLRLRSEGVARLNFFITAASVALGGVFVLGSGNNIPLADFKLILLITLTLLFMIGLDIHAYLIQRDIGSDRHMRGLARIRNYFVQLDPGIYDYFVNPIQDSPTSFLILKNSGMRRTTQIVESFFAGSAVALLSTFLRLNDRVVIGAGIGLAILAFLLLEVNARRKLQKAFKNATREIKLISAPTARQSANAQRTSKGKL